MWRKIKAAIASIFASLSGSLRADVHDQEQRVKIIELAFQQQQRTIDTLNEMIVSMRLRIKEVREECIADGIETKRRLTDANQRIDELELRQDARSNKPTPPAGV